MIEQRIEAPDHREPDYVGRQLTADEIERGIHRKWVGAHWGEHGLHQLEFLQSEGLKPDQKLLDVGCGSLRAGRHFVEYLDAGNYYGMDANHSVVVAGYEREIDDALRAKLPEENLRSSDRFDVDFGVQFDVALAQSVFTHLPLNHIRLCFYRLSKVMPIGNKFYATFNEQRPSFPIDGIVMTKKRKFGERNTYWSYRQDIVWAASFSGWQPRYIGDWGHPGGQKMMEFTRVPVRPPKTKPAAEPAVAEPARAPAAPASPPAAQPWTLKRIIRSGPLRIKKIVN